MESGKAKRLLRGLIEVLSDRREVHLHQWQYQDILLWDNERVMHRAQPAVAGTTKVSLRAIVTAWTE
jgi:alpha-ketoglutarate-dependent taurine dioxygenase